MLPEAAVAASPLNIMKLRSTVREKSAAIVKVLIFPRFLIPIFIRFTESDFKLKLNFAANRIINIDKLIHKKEHKKRIREIKDLKMGFYKIKKLRILARR